MMNCHYEILKSHYEIVKLGFVIHWQVANRGPISYQFFLTIYLYFVQFWHVWFGKVGKIEDKEMIEDDIFNLINLIKSFKNPFKILLKSFKNPLKIE